jgi:hypothetical protein
VNFETLRRARQLTPRHALWVGLLLAPVLLLAPWLVQRSLDSALVPAAGVALAAYLARRRWPDAVLLGAAVLAADVAEIGFAPHLFVLVAVPVLVLTWRPRFAAFCGLALLALVGAAAYFKERYAGSTLSWQDVQYFFLQFGDNIGVMATQPALLLSSSSMIAPGLLACWLVWRWDGRRGGVSRLQCAGTLLLCAGLLATSGGAVRAEIVHLRNAGAWHLGVSSTSEVFSRFFTTAAIQPEWTVPPTDTSAFSRDAARRISAPGKAAADIVVVLQESQFNPATIAGCPAKLCELPVFGATADTVAHGPLRVHVYGGGTWSTEFSLATGVPHRTFGPAGDFAPFNVAPGVRRSFVRSLKAAGYRTVAVYPVGGGMMNARAAYAAYGFDHFYDSRDLGMRGRFDTTDEDMHAAARRVLAEERKAGAPVFLLLVTIFNHADHGILPDRVPAAIAAQARAAFADPHEATNVADYVWRTSEFQRASRVTRDAVLDAGRPAVFAWFGDHQPPFGDAMSLRGRIQAVPTGAGTMPATYQTWYQVRSNTGKMPPEPGLRGLDLVFLPGLLAQAAGVPLDDWLAANVEAREACGGLLEKCGRPGVPEAYLSHLRQDLHAFRLP